MLQSSQMMKCVVAHLVASIHNLLVQFGVAAHVIAHHEEGSLGIKLLQCFKDERRGLRNGPIVEGQIHGLLGGVHSPGCIRIQPS